MIVNKEFADWAVGFSGFDGGNPAALIWISGIEWGGDDKPILWPNEYTFQDEEGKYIPCRNERYRVKYPNYLSYRFDQKVAKLLVNLFGEQVGCNDYKDYMEQYLYTENGHCFRLNLYPLNAPKSNDELWTKDYYELTGFPTKILYWAWCTENRFPFLKQLVEKYSPKVIIGTGSTFRRDYILAFAEPSLIFTRNRIENIQSTKFNVEMVTTNSGKTNLLITPFFGQGGIMSDSGIDGLAMIINQFL
jgi:hypothetical protein